MVFLGSLEYFLGNIMQFRGCNCLLSLVLLICWYQGYWGATMLPLAQYSLLEDSESVLLPTDTGTQEGTSNRATEAPTAEHDDDNSLGYTGTASYFFPKNTTAIGVLSDNIFK